MTFQVASERQEEYKSKIPFLIKDCIVNKNDTIINRLTEINKRVTSTTPMGLPLLTSFNLDHLIHGQFFYMFHHCCFYFNRFVNKYADNSLSIQFFYSKILYDITAFQTLRKLISL